MELKRMVLYFLVDKGWSHLCSQLQWHVVEIELDHQIGVAFLTTNLDKSNSFFFLIKKKKTLDKSHGNISLLVTDHKELLICIPQKNIHDHKELLICISQKRIIHLYREANNCVNTLL